MLLYFSDNAFFADTVLAIIIRLGSHVKLVQLPGRGSSSPIGQGEFFNDMMFRSLFRTTYS